MSNVKRRIKMRVNPEQSQKIQEICFENGIVWCFSDNTVRHIDEPFLFISKDFLGWVGLSQEDFFIEDENEEVSAELFIRTNGTCIKKKTKKNIK